MIGVSWSGQVYALDSFTGAVSPLSAGLPGQNASARDDHGRIWSTASGGALTIIDPSQSSTSYPLPGFSADLRGLANGGGQFMVGIESGPIDSLVRIDKITGVKMTVGATGFSHIEALENHNYHLYAWDTVEGLLEVNQATGVATNINPAIGGAGVQIEWLSTRSDGKLVGGQDSLYEIDVHTGVITFIAYLGPLDLRGADAWQTATQAFGTGCNGSFGLVTLSGTVALTGTAGSSSPVVTMTSTNHSPNMPGVTIFGLSNTGYGPFGNNPLPLSLDPILGTVGCSVLTSWDTGVLSVTTASGPATLEHQFVVPPLNDLVTFFVQHIVIEPVTGNVSMSNGLIVQAGH
ncbi:MAG: hypothetical protein ABIP94_09255 [Planctomycetota bacterium]